MSSNSLVRVLWFRRPQFESCHLIISSDLRTHLHSPYLSTSAKRPGTDREKSAKKIRVLDIAKFSGMRREEVRPAE